VTSNEPLRVVLRLLNYPAWRVEVNGKAVTPQHAELSGQMILPLAPGTQRLTAKFVRRPDRTLGSVISLLGVLTLLALLNAGGLRLLSASMKNNADFNTPTRSGQAGHRVHRDGSGVMTGTVDWNSTKTRDFLDVRFDAPVPSQLVLKMGLMARTNGTSIMK